MGSVDKIGAVIGVTVKTIGFRGIGVPPLFAVTLREIGDACTSALDVTPLSVPSEDTWICDAGGRPLTIVNCAGLEEGLYTKSDKLNGQQELPQCIGGKGIGTGRADKL